MLTTQKLPRTTLCKVPVKLQSQILFVQDTPTDYTDILNFAYSDMYLVDLLLLTNHFLYSIPSKRYCHDLYRETRNRGKLSTNFCHRLSMMRSSDMQL